MSVECPKCTEAFAPTLDISGLPTNFDWRTKHAVNPVQEQKCNDWWAFASTANVESAHVVQERGALTKFSEQQAIDCGRRLAGSAGGSSCQDGGFEWDTWRYLVNTNHSLSTLASYPYRKECADCDAKSAAHGCSGKDGPGPKVRDWIRISSDEDQMAAALMKYGPIVASLNAKGLQFYSGKVIKPKIKVPMKVPFVDKRSFPPQIKFRSVFIPICNNSVDHAVVLVGFGVEDGIKYWLIRNSWGTWGDAGYVKVQRGVGACGLHLFPVTAIMANAVTQLRTNNGVVCFTTAGLAIVDGFIGQRGWASREDVAASFSTQQWLDFPPTKGNVQLCM
jgi:hypothetical protein